MTIKKSDNKKVLCVVAHPDDEALGVGGTLIKHSKNKDKVDLIILSVGEGAKRKKADIKPEISLEAIESLNSKESVNICRSCRVYRIYNYNSIIL